MGEDEKFQIIEELQKRVDTANTELDKAFASKEAEMTS